MNSNLKKSALLLLLLPLLFFSCTKTEYQEIEVAPRYSWKINDHFLYKHSIQMNSFEGEKSLYLSGFEGLTEIYYRGDIEFADHYFKHNKTQVAYKYPLNGDVFTSTNDSRVLFTSTKNPVFNSSSIHAGVNMVEVDPAFAEFDFRTYETGECFKLTKNNVALIPYKIYDFETYSRPMITKSRLLLVKLEMTGADKDRPNITKATALDQLKLSNIHYVQAFDNYFYVTDRNEKFYRISEDGESEELMVKGMFTMYKYEGVLYGFSTDGLHKSTNGKEWVRLIPASDNPSFIDLSRLDYHNLSNGLLIATNNSQLFKVDFTESKFLVKELDNSGLEGNKITSIARFNNKIYVTTLSGVFTRGEDKFLTLKQEDK